MISKGLLVSSNPPKKQMNKFVFTTGGPRLVRILGPGKNRTSEIRTSGYYIAYFH